jgi:hypothetical protein
VERFESALDLRSMIILRGDRHTTQAMMHASNIAPRKRTDPIARSAIAKRHTSHGAPSADISRRDRLSALPCVNDTVNLRLIRTPNIFRDVLLRGRRALTARDSGM